MPGETLMTKKILTKTPQPLKDQIQTYSTKLLILYYRSVTKKSELSNKLFQLIMNQFEQWEYLLLIFNITLRLSHFYVQNLLIAIWAAFTLPVYYWPFLW